MFPKNFQNTSDLCFNCKNIFILKATIRQTREIFMSIGLLSRASGQIINN